MIYDILMQEAELSVKYLESKKEEIFGIIPELKMNMDLKITMLRKKNF